MNSRYFDSNIRRIKEFLDYHDEETLAEINAICHAHVLALDVDEDKRWSYCGGDVVDGKLRILFEPTYLGTNIGQALERDVLMEAINKAEDPKREESGLSFKARLSKRTDYDARIEEIRSKIGEALAKPDIKLTPNLEDTFAKLQAESQVKGTSLDAKYWESQVPDWTRGYFDGFLSQLKWQKFDEDDMLQEGFNEAVDKGEIAFRVVDKLKFKSYCEFEIEDGVFYLQVRLPLFLRAKSVMCRRLVLLTFIVVHSQNVGIEYERRGREYHRQAVEYLTRLEVLR